jgi:hypothetical protein
MAHCWCGHGPWHHRGYGYGPPPYAYEPDYGPEDWPPRRRRRRPDEEDLADYLGELEDELRRVRVELERLRQSRCSESE